MIFVPFDPRRDLIIVSAELSGPLGRSILRMVLDTGASQTIIAPHVLDKLGYGARDGEAITSVVSVVGKESGYRIRVRHLRCLGHLFDDFPVAAHDFYDGPDFDGLLGLNFLNEFNYEVRSKEGRIRVERA